MSAFSPSTSEESDLLDWLLMSSYSRATALADGNLVDVTETAREAGFRVPVALTASVWSDCVRWSAEDAQVRPHQDEKGRLWDVLSVAALTARQLRTRNIHRATFQVFRVQSGATDHAARVMLVLDIGPGDEGEAVATIGFPEDF